MISTTNIQVRKSWDRAWAKLDLENWSNTLSNTLPQINSDPGVASEQFDKWIISSLNDIIPYKWLKKRPKEKQTPWYTPKACEYKQECKRLERAWRKDFSQEKKQKYREAITIYQTEIKRAQTQYYEKKINEANNAPREIARIVKSLTNGPQAELPTDTAAKRCMELAEFFNKVLDI